MKKLMILGVGLAMLNLTSCKKGEEDPGMSFKSRAGRLAGTWTVTEYSDKTTWTGNYEDDADNDGDLIKSESTEEITYDGTSMSYSETSTDTYDGKGFVDSRSTELTASGSTITMKETEVNDDGTETYEMDGTYSSSFAASITFEKDGTFSMTRNQSMTGEFTDSGTGYTSTDESTSSEEATITGTWSFVSKNKNQEFKNKERVALWFDMNDSKSTESSESKTTYDGGGEYTSSSTSTNDNSNVSTSTDPDEVWQFVMLSGKESKVVSNSTWTSDSKYSYSYSYDDGSGTTTTTSESDGSSEGTSETSFTMTKD